MDMLSTLVVQLDELEKTDRAAEPGLGNAMCAGRAPLMWMMLLLLHVNQKHDDEEWWF